MKTCFLKTCFQSHDWVFRINLVFFETPEVGIIGIFYVTSNGNKLEIVTDQMNLSANLDLSRAY